MSDVTPTPSPKAASSQGVEPVTDDMLQAARDTLPGGFTDICDADLEDIWEAMHRAASPSPSRDAAVPASGAEAVYRVTKRGAFVEHEPLLPAFDMPDGTYDLYLAKPASEPADGAVRTILPHEGWRYGELIYNALYANKGGVWRAVSDHDKDTVWYPAGYRFAIAAALSAPASSSPAEEGRADG